MTQRRAAGRSARIANSSFGRRHVLAGSCALLTTALLPSVGLAATETSTETSIEALLGLSERRLVLYNPRTLENLNLVYWRDGGYDPIVLRAVNWFMRDIRAEAAKDIDCALLDLICSMHRATESTEPFVILSGYRSVETNHQLIEMGVHAAEHSFHIEGKAVDLRMSGFSTKGLRYLAAERQVGGIGYYPQDEFLHIDTGPVRFWQG